MIFNFLKGYSLLVCTKHPLDPFGLFPVYIPKFVYVLISKLRGSLGRRVLISEGESGATSRTVGVFP